MEKCKSTELRGSAFACQRKVACKMKTEENIRWLPMIP